MLIEQEVSGDIDELTQLFKHSPEKAERGHSKSPIKTQSLVRTASVAGYVPTDEGLPKTAERVEPDQSSAE